MRTWRALTGSYATVSHIYKCWRKKQTDDGKTERQKYRSRAKTNEMNENPTQKPTDGKGHRIARARLKTFATQNGAALRSC